MNSARALAPKMRPVGASAVAVFLVAVLATLAKGAIAQPSGTTNRYTGYLFDIYCWFLNPDEPFHRALDGALLETNPEDHYLHCMRDGPSALLPLLSLRTDAMPAP